MRVVLGSDERTELTDAVQADLEARGAQVVLVGPPAGEERRGQRSAGASVSRSRGEVDTGVCFCWTGTGASIAANKVAGVRAALCTDAETAAGARKWNDANVLVMSLRLTTPQVARRSSTRGSRRRPIRRRPPTSPASRRPRSTRVPVCRPT